MTKAWELHEETIKKLYAENTLAVVRRTMIDKYNFTASTRAYRGRLIKWGVRKYNCRRRSGSISASSPDGSVSESDIASPTLSQPTVETSHDLARYSTSGHTRDNERRMPSMLEGPYSTMEIDSSRAYTEKPLAPPPQKMHCAWDATQTQPTSPLTNFSHGNMISAPGPLYEYPPLSPTSSSYPSAIYESTHADRDRRQSFPLMPIRQYNTIHEGPDYSAMRSYGHGQRGTEMGSFYSIRDPASKHIPRS
ncbi:hypothetical protein F4825DRAFT_464514 [Nemania diffusa]|nr:hypothetical protein F4825DRAFT_464514 [Nemania diffusa]